MRRAWRFGLALGLLAAIASPLVAGLYDPRQLNSPFATDRGVRAYPYELFRDALAEVRSISDPRQQGKTRTEFLGRQTAFVQRGLSSLSPMELVESAFVQQRLRQSDEALNTLRQAMGRDPRSFWVQTQLGAIYQASNQLQEAAQYTAAARDAFPDPWPGGAAAGAWFKRVEVYQSQLLRLRLAEGAGRSGRRGGAVNDVDALFPARLVGRSGQFEAGKIADAEKAKLPADAIAIVQQLILWFPDDTRLLWLLGELYNADGDLDSAFSIFQECVGGRSFDSATLRDHRRQVIEAREALAKAKPAPDPPKPKEAILPDQTTLWIVGGVFGAILATLGWLQFRELFRRLRSPARRPS